MKALILSCNTGGGHNSAGKALYEEITNRGIYCELCDALKFSSEKASDRISNLYIQSTLKAPNAFGFCYKAGEIVNKLPIKSPVYYANKLYAKNLHRYILQNEFDTIIMPHVFPAETVTYLKKRKNLQVTACAVATDYTCIPFFDETEMDYYFIPSSLLKDEFLKKSVSKNSIVSSGIPVSGKFNVKTQKSTARASLHLPENKPTVLIMTGSMGFGNLTAFIRLLFERLPKNTQIVLLCGNNEQMKARLRSDFPENNNLHLVDFTDQVPLYMDACDILITKPGGLSSTEAAVKNVPLIHSFPIPGCETHNARFFDEHGMSRVCHTSRQDLADALDLLDDEPARLAMIRRQQALIHPDAAVQISILAENMA